MRTDNVHAPRHGNARLPAAAHDAADDALDLHGALRLEVDEHARLEVLRRDGEGFTLGVALGVLEERAFFREGDGHVRDGEARRARDADRLDGGRIRSAAGQSAGLVSGAERMGDSPPP
jgi:hypothetical protein